MANKKKEEFNHIEPDATTECMVKLTGAEKETYILYEAISNNDLEQAEKAIKRGANTNAPNKPCSPESAETPLDAAIYWANSFNCSKDMINLLRRYGARSLNRDMDKFFEKVNDCHIDYNKKK